MTDVWGCPGGMTATGLAGRAIGLRLRNAFLGTVAAGALSLAFGGPALAGPDACTVDGTGTIETCSGNQSAGIASGVDFTAPPVTTLSVNNLTQAITPGGFTSGINIASAGAITITSNTGAFGISTAGGFGIYAFATGAVTVTSTGNITTPGVEANGILASSTIGGSAVTVTSTGNITTTGANASGIGAYSSGAGAVTVTSIGNIATTGVGIDALTFGSGAIKVTSTGNITTSGSNAYGIFAQGRGTGAVTVASTGNITTAGDSASGIRVVATDAFPTKVTSIGNIATAGNSASGISVSAQSGAVTVTSTGNISTTGDNAKGIYSAAFSVSGAAAAVTSTGNITTAGVNAFGLEAYSAAGNVVVTSTGNITTTGQRAFGISATGHNHGGVTTVTSTGNIITTGLQAHGIFALNNDGPVTVTSTGTITTAGNYAFGIFSSGGAVTVTSTGNIVTTGNRAFGLYANSFGAVTMTSTGNITTTGDNSSAIVAQSAGGPIAVTINSGTVSGGSGTGAGVVITGGTDNTLVNRGTVTALSGLAIAAGTGNDTVSNFGTMIGSVDLGAGTNAFNNMAGGLFNSGAGVNLGAGNTLTNAGTLSPGGAGVIQTTALTGNLVQTTTGQLAIDFNMAGASADRVNVSGTANLAGVVQLQLSNPQLGAFQKTIVSAAGGATNNGLSLLASPALQAQLVFPNTTDVVVKSTGINFAVAGLNTNQTALGNALNGAALTGGLGSPIFNVLLNGVTSLPGYNAALNQLTGESATGSQQATFSAMNTFMGTMLDPFNRDTGSAPGSGASGYAAESDANAYAADGRKRSGAERDAYAMFTKAPPQNFEARWNVWAAGFGGSQTTDGSVAAGTNGSTSRIAGTAVGADYLFSPNTIAGFALAGGGTSYTVGNGLGSGRSDLFQAGVYMRHTMGAAYIAGALAYGWQDITTNRTVTLAGIDQLQARFNANAYSGRVEGGYRFVSPLIGGIGITPYAAAQFTTFDLPAYAEQAVIGTNNFALAYGAKSVTDPRSELGFRTDKSFALQDGVLTLRSRFAWAHDYDPNRSIGATFQSLPGASFVVNGAAQASDSALTTASVEMKWRNNWSVAATFEGEFSNVTSSYAGKGVVRYQW